MARFNEILVGRYNRHLQKLFGMKDNAPVPILGTEITPSYSLFVGNENRILESQDLCGVGNLSPATAAQTVGIQFRVPNQSNVVATFHSIILASGIAQEIDFSFGNVGDFGAGSFASFILDPRSQRVSPVTQASQSLASPGSLTGPFARIFVAANTPFEVIGDPVNELVVPSANSGPSNTGNVLRIITTVANQTLFVSARWRERFLEESERT